MIERKTTLIAPECGPDPVLDAKVYYHMHTKSKRSVISPLNAFLLSGGSRVTRVCQE